MSWFITMLAALVLSVLAYWQHWRWSHKGMLQLTALVPGPPALPFIGNSLIFMVNPGEQLQKNSALFQKYGEYFRFWLGSDLNICVKNPADIRLLLTSNKVNQKGPAYDFMKKYIGPGILTGGPTWLSHRKIATPSYSKKSVQHSASIFNKEAECLVKILCRNEPNTPVNVYYDVVKITTQCVCQTLMGLSKKDSQDLTRMDEVVSFTQSMYDHLFKKMTRWWLQVPLIYWLVGGKKMEHYYLEAINDFVSDIVRKRQIALKDVSVIDTEALGIVDRYILSGELTEQEIKWETFS